ncbi:unnamed protein product, partial [Thelazia callipaeda]|uniref:MFS_4 domain-containing protein n=1 Tax=Thelazia callipaeda TaxID=103827 RepID=A0A158RC33_THECL
IDDGSEEERSNYGTSVTHDCFSEFFEALFCCNILRRQTFTNFCDFVFTKAYKNDSVLEDLDDVLPAPPDGGYGWVIVFAAFMSNFVVDGIANSFGAFMSIYQEYFDAPKALVSLIGSLLIGCYLLIGPVAGGLVNKYGARMVVIIGTIVAGSSFFASIACSNIYIFMIFYGFLGGAGFGLIYLPSIVTVGYYFEKKRSIATGMAVAGSGVGTFVLPIAEFGWKVAVGSLAALTFSSIIYGLLYRPLSATVKDRKKNAKADVEQMVRLFIKLKRFILSNEYVLSACSIGSQAASITDLKTSHGNLINPLSKISARSFAQSISRLSQSSRIKGAQSLMSVASSLNPKEFNKPMNRRDIFYSGSIRNLSEFKSEGTMSFISFLYRESQTLIPASTVAKVVSGASHLEVISDIGDKFDESHQISKNQLEQSNEVLDFYDDSKCNWIPIAIRNALTEMIDVSLLKEPSMFLLCISNLFGMLGFYVPFMFLIDMAVAKGHTKGSGSLLLSVIGVTNTVGRIAFGWLADRGWVSALTINNLALIGCGLLTCLCPLLPGFGGLMFYSILFGFIISAYISLTSIVLVDELGLDRLTNSFGLLVVSRGIASLLGTPLAGIVYDLFTSYDASFYFAGVIILMSGLVSCLIPVIRYCKHKKFAEKTVQQNRRTDEEIHSGKLSVLTEHSEENLTEYQRTLQSLQQERKLLEELNSN